ncbi:MAG: pilus assembly PilX N-terminal domain-containing protein [Candidatus Saccharibacteria bacterium]
MIKKYLKLLTKSESGYASFVVTLVTIVIISLIVIAFATDSRIEQKNSTANSESTQAYYAAESGINDAYAVVSYDIKNPSNTIQSTGNQCASSTNTGKVYITNTNSNQINGSNVEYTCLIVNSTPTSILKDIQPGQAQVVPITTTTPLSYITISWQDTSVSSPSFTGCPSSAGSFSPLGNATGQYNSNTCSAGVIQADLLSGGNLSSELASNQYNSQATSVFLEPTKNPSASGSVATDTASQDKAFGVLCGTGSGQYSCTAKLAVASSSTYYLHLQAVYAPIEVFISVASTSTGPALPISNSQILIDSTGEAAGQLKRIQERVCDNTYCGNGAPGQPVISTQCIDKSFTVYPGEATATVPTC